MWSPFSEGLQKAIGAEGQIISNSVSARLEDRLLVPLSPVPIKQWDPW